MNTTKGRLLIALLVTMMIASMPLITLAQEDFNPMEDAACRCSEAAARWMETQQLASMTSLPILGTAADVSDFTGMESAAARFSEAALRWMDVQRTVSVEVYVPTAHVLMIDAASRFSEDAVHWLYAQRFGDVTMLPILGIADEDTTINPITVPTNNHR